MAEKQQKKCAECACPVDMHVAPGVMGVHDRGGCAMLKRPKPDVLRVARCECVRTPDTFLTVAR
jgi:hypothetical protein